MVFTLVELTVVCVAVVHLGVFVLIQVWFGV